MAFVRTGSRCGAICICGAILVQDAWFANTRCSVTVEIRGAIFVRCALGRVVVIVCIRVVVSVLS